MRRYRGWLAVLGLGFAAACEAGAQSGGSPPPVRYPGTTARLESPARVRRGDSLSLRLLICNETGSRIMLPMTWQGDGGFDPIVRDSKGHVVWRASRGKPRFAGAESRGIQPHQTTTYRATWNLRDPSGFSVPPGTYRITGQLLNGRDSVIVSVADVPVVIEP